MKLYCFGNRLFLENRRLLNAHGGELPSEPPLPLGEDAYANRPERVESHTERVGNERLARRHPPETTEHRHPPEEVTAHPEAEGNARLQRARERVERLDPAMREFSDYISKEGYRLHEDTDVKAPHGYMNAVAVYRKELNPSEGSLAMRVYIFRKPGGGELSIRIAREVQRALGSIFLRPLTNEIPLDDPSRISTVLDQALQEERRVFQSVAEVNLDSDPELASILEDSESRAEQTRKYLAKSRVKRAMDGNFDLGWIGLSGAIVGDIPENFLEQDGWLCLAVYRMQKSLGIQPADGVYGKKTHRAMVREIERSDRA